MSELNKETVQQPETITKSQVASFCRHLGRSLKGAGSSDTEMASNLMRESEYLEKNGFSVVSEMFMIVATTLDPNLSQE